MKLKLICIAVLISASVFGQNVPSYVPTNGLVGWWPFNGNANDESGNGNNGIVNGAILTNDRNGSINNAYDFNGLNSFIEANGNTINVSDTFTISLWMQSIATPAILGNYTLFELGGSGLSGVRWGALVDPTNAVLAAGRGCGGTGNSLVSISGGSGWRHYVFVVSGTNHSIYENGILKGNSTNSLISALGCSTSSLYFGVSQWSSPYYYSGKLDEIGLWNRALTQQEITALYQSQQTQCLPAYVPTNGLVGWWPFCGNANDESGNGYHATPINGSQGNFSYGFDRNGNTNSSGYFNNPAAWNGDGAYLTLPSTVPLSLSSDYTFSLWASPSSTSTSELINRGRDNNGAFVSRISNNYFQIASGSSGINNLDPTIYNQWNHFIIKRMSNSLYLYKNAVLVDSSAAINPQSLSPQFWIGKHNEQGSGNGSTYPYVGFLDDIGMWNRALTQQEITALYNSSSTSISEITPSSSMFIYPNPAADVLNVKSDAKNVGSSYRIMDATGRIITNGIINSESMTLDMGQYASGMYLFIIGNGGDSIKIFKN